MRRGWMAMVAAAGITAASVAGPAHAAPSPVGVITEVVNAPGLLPSPLPDEIQDVFDEVAACTDPAYSLEGWRESSIHRWRFNARSTPAGLSVTQVRTALLQATSAITGATNSCGMADNVSARASFDGDTSTGTNINSSGSCGSRDGISVTGFGKLPSGALAVACVWYSTASRPYEVVESDVKLNRNYAWFTTRPVPCADRYDIQSVVAHERGHTFGLGHVSEADHAGQTMSTQGRPCSISERTLGQGDVLGLEALY
ncbi:MAG TPA: matrixin family metalloprotease [Actinomycetota bacterium]